MRLRKPITDDVVIDLDKPIDKFEFMAWKKKLPARNPLRKCYIDGQRLICDSDNDRLKIAAYLLPLLNEQFDGCI